MAAEVCRPLLDHREFNVANCNGNVLMSGSSGRRQVAAAPVHGGPVQWSMADDDEEAGMDVDDVDELVDEEDTEINLPVTNGKFFLILLFLLLHYYSDLATRAILASGNISH